MESSRAAAVLAACLAVSTAAAAAAQEEPAEAHEHADETESCCADAGPVELAPLPDDATDKERALWHYAADCRLLKANVYLSPLVREEFEARLAALGPQASLEDRFSLRFTLCRMLIEAGQLDRAIALGEECVALCDEHRDEAAAWLPETLFRLAAAHFRRAEKDNCIANHNADSCILPLVNGAVHLKREGAEAARVVLDRLLKTPGSDLALEARWLLNIAHMALGTWPDGVPAEYRIDRSAFESEVKLPRFVDRARELGLAHHSHAGSMVLDDFTGDGRIDVVACAFDPDRPLRFLRNEGDGRFTDATEEAGLARQLGGIDAFQGDVDGDGRLDLVVLRGGGFYSGDQVPDSLLRQDRDGHFVDVTREAGIEIAAPTRAGAFADVDGDGDLDLFVGYESEPDPSGPRFPSRMFVNDGKGKFADDTKRCGVANNDRVTGCAFGDVDQDGLPDLFVANWYAPHRMFMNHGDKGFVDEAAVRGLVGPVPAGPLAFLDVENDGDLDLFVGRFEHYRQLQSVARYYLDGKIEGDTQKLFENDGKGTFRDATAERGLRRVAHATGLNVGDVDDDGFPDLYVATGSHDMAGLFPNLLLVNRAGTFRDATFGAGVGHLQKGNGVAMADLDDDGDLEIGVQVGGFHADDAFGDVMFENPGSGHRHLEVELAGVRDNRFGLGARIRARIVEKDGERDVFATVGPGGSLGCNPMRAHLGLGDATRIAFVEVRWPASGKTQRIESVPLDARIRVRQDRDGFETLEYRPFALHGR